MSSEPRLRPLIWLSQAEFDKHLPRLLEAHPGLSENTALQALGSAIRRRELLCRVPSLKNCFPSWIYLPPQLEFHHDDVVITSSGTGQIDLRTWKFVYQGRGYAIQILLLKIIDLFQLQLGALRIPSDTETQEAEKLEAAENEQLDAMLLALWQARPAGKPGLSRDTDLRPKWQEALRERGLRSEWKAVLARFNRPEHRYMHNRPGRRQGVPAAVDGPSSDDSQHRPTQ